MNLNYYDLNEKGFNIICSVLDKYCVHYKTRVNTREILFGSNSSYEVHTQELNPDAYIFVKDKIEQQLELIAKLDYQHDLPAREPEWDKEEKQDSGMTLADLIERNLQAERNVFKPFKGEDTNSFVTTTECCSWSPIKSELEEEAKKEKEGYDLFNNMKDFIKKGASNLKDSLEHAINNAQKKGILRALSDEVSMSYEELPTDLKEILLTQMPLSFLKKAKFKLVKNSDGFAISIDGDNE